jgi:hypothetical protein
MVRRLMDAYAASGRYWIIDAETPQQTAMDTISLALRIAMLTACTTCF